jgi:myo-inositol-1(or 4)-monophosphatase
MTTPTADRLSPALLEEYAAFTLCLAEESAALAVSQFGTSVARRKSDGTLVTRTDEQIDRLITGRIVAAYPGDTILSEEQATLFDPGIERTWIIDPVDGTTNFARGLLTWGVSIGLLINGSPVVGVVYFPMLHEVYSAVVGQGAFCNGEAIRTAPERLPDDQHLFMECTRTRRVYRFDIPLKSRMLGSAAYHICKVAEGTALAGSEATPKVWDIAAAALILVEAGGVLRTAKQKTVFPLAAAHMDYATHAYPVLYAANEEVWQAVYAGMRPVRHAGRPR